MPETDYDVVIIGLGPVGATFANLLGLCGVSTLVLERERQAYPLPRAVHFDDEVMRIFQTIGLADEISAIARFNVGMRFIDATGKLLLDWPRPEAVTPQGWLSSYRFHQPDLEDILRQGLARYPHVVTRLGCDAIAIDDKGNHVGIRYEDLNTGKIHTLTSRYLVGCDGARSLVRRFIGSEMIDYGFHERWLVVDTLLTQPKPELGDFTIQYCNPERPMTYVRGPKNRRRWEITLHAEEDSHTMSQPEVVWRLLSDWMKPHEATVERAAVYTFHSVSAQTWAKGRLMLAGDAAHQTPPFMGQGMCAGIRDAANLAWKLALVLQGQAREDLLASYQRERAPHTIAYIKTAIRLGGLINTCGTEEALRAAFPQADGSAKMQSIAPPLGQGLRRGNTRHCGRLFPQPRLADGQLLDEAVGYRSVMIAMPEVLPTNPLSVCLLDASLHPACAQALEELDCQAVFVRPDRYILGTATTQAEADELIAASALYP